MRYFTVYGWITEWRRKRVLQKHALDDALWRRSTKGLSFLPQVPKLKELVLLFLAENSSQARTAWKSPTRCE